MTTPRYFHGKKSRIGKDAPSAAGFRWIFARVVAGQDLDGPTGGIVLRPSDRCARCHHPLTVPASIDSGFGPVCAEKIGAEWTERVKGGEFIPLVFILGGAINAAGHRFSAVFTASSTSGKRYTYQVEPMPVAEGDRSRRWSVRVLTGADNTSDYTYLGTIFQDLDTTERSDG